MSVLQNYVFDLYGTLLDIETDERKLSMWSAMTDFYNVYGCDWEPKQLREAYFRMDEEERRLIRERFGFENPEIKLEKVFARLLFEVPNTHSCSFFIDGMGIDLLRSMYERDREQILQSVMRSEWVVATANLFRLASRKYIRPYPNSERVLRALREAGKRVFLLSNAQKVFTYPEIEQSGLLPYFDAVYISSDFGLKKPEAELLHILLREQQLKKEETVMIGNEIESDVKIAIRCGIGSIYLNTYGYTAAAIDERMHELLLEHRIAKHLMPRIILSGDVGELL